MAFTEDFTEFFDTGDFAVTATVGGSSVNGIFDYEYVEVNDIAGEAPVLMLSTADAGSAAYGTACVVNSTNYLIRVRKDDGVGVTTLILEEQ